MTAVLSEDEIDELLKAINGGDTESEEPKTFRPSADTRKIKIYDFKRPDVFSKDQLRTLSMVHEFFCRETTLSLSAKLRSMVHVHIASVDCLTYEEFIRSIPTPTSLGVIEASPLKGNIVIEIDQSSSFAAIDLTFGGSGKEIEKQHELTLIEQAVIKNLFPLLLENLRGAWARITDLHPKLVRFETLPQFTQVVPSTEMVALLTLETKVGDSVGMINIVYPYSVIAPIANKLTPSFIYEGETSTYVRESADFAVKNSIHSPWENIPLKLTAEIFKRDYSIKELLNWKEETIILPLRYVAPNHCYLRLGERRVWRCKILEDEKWFSKKIEITGKTENPFGTEGKKMTFNHFNQFDQVDQGVTDALAAVKVTVTVELGTTEMPIKQLFGICEGTIIELDAHAGEPAIVKANGVTIANGEVVVIDECFGIRICEMLAKVNPNIAVKFPPLKQAENESPDPADEGEL